MDQTDPHQAAIRTVQAKRISTADPGKPPIDEAVDVIIESAFIIDVESVERYTVLCTPLDQRAMAVGFLFSEGVIDGMSDIALLKECDDDPNLMNVKLKGKVPRIMDPGRNLVIVSSCGACGTEEFDQKLNALPKVKNTLRVDSRVLRSATGNIGKNQPLFKACGGTHAIGLFDARGKIIASAEDTGRHNALDKAIGKCLLEGVPIAGLGAVLSGRVSLEMVGKCARAGIELISAISAPTSMALDVAERCGITLCAFVREDRATIFTHPERVTA
ncbi:MAG: formate dehydrogenase accessory sulfurtransferase FdhD [Planctomycetota bacterium]|jgi:FdhD protein